MNKYNQNSFGEYKGFRWFSTKKEVLVLTERGMRKAAVKHEKDFNFKALFDFAIWEPNAK